MPHRLDAVCDVGAGTFLDGDDNDDDERSLLSKVVASPQEGYGICKRCPEGWTSIGGIPERTGCYSDGNSTQNFSLAFSVRQNLSSSSGMHMTTFAHAVGYTIERHVSSVVPRGALVPIPSVRLSSVHPLKSVQKVYTAAFSFQGGRMMKSTLMDIVNSSSSDCLSSSSNATIDMDACEIASEVHPDTYLLSEVHVHDLKHGRALEDHEHHIAKLFRRKLTRKLASPTPSPTTASTYKGSSSYYKDVASTLSYFSKVRG